MTEPTIHRDDDYHRCAMLAEAHKGSVVAARNLRSSKLERVVTDGRRSKQRGALTMQIVLSDAATAAVVLLVALLASCGYGRR
jgi:hypothetical protein